MTVRPPDPEANAALRVSMRLLDAIAQSDISVYEREQCIGELVALAASVADQQTLREALRPLLDLVNEQAEDEALWALNLDGTLPISEAYLQQELRRLHELVEAAAALAAVEAGGQ